MSEPMTVGEKVDRDGPCLLMALVVELAEAHKRIPVGHWMLDLADGWQLEVNGTKDTIGHLPPWNSVVSHGGLPVVMFDAAGGMQVGHGGEEAAIEALKAAVAERAGEQE